MKRVRIGMAGKLNRVLLLALCVAGLPCGAAEALGQFSLTVLNVPKAEDSGGAGLAVVMRTPSGRTFLYDTGNGYCAAESPEFAKCLNTGRDLIAPYLRARGVSAIDGLIISHAHADHFGGFVWLVDHFPIRKLWDTGYTLPGKAATDYQGEQGWYAKLRDQYRARFPDAYGTIHAGDVLAWDDRIEVEVLSPPQTFFSELPSDTRPKNDGPSHHLINANAVVLRIRHGRVVFLILGDIQQDYLKERLWPMLSPEKKKCDVCIVASHGIHSIKEEAEATRPTVAVGSVWLPWAKNLPMWKVYGAVGATVYVTGVNGHVEIVSDGEQVTVKTEREFRLESPESNKAAHELK